MFESLATELLLTAGGGILGTFFAHCLFLLVVLPTLWEGLV